MEKLKVRKASKLGKIFILQGTIIIEIHWAKFKIKFFLQNNLDLGNFQMIDDFFVILFYGESFICTY